jgi:hypothetical protein
LSKGFYWEDGDLKEDSFGDWLLFSEPLRRCLWPQEVERNSEYVGSKINLEQKNLMLGAISYTDSIEALVRFWTNSKEKLLDRIQSQ